MQGNRQLTKFQYIWSDTHFEEVDAYIDTFQTIISYNVYNKCKRYKDIIALPLYKRVINENEKLIKSILMKPGKG